MATEDDGLPANRAGAGLDRVHVSFFVLVPANPLITCFVHQVMELQP